MVRPIKDFIRYTLSELENYTKCEGSCIKKINQILHINFPPYGLGSFKATLLKIISEKKIGSYDTKLNGIILDIRNIKVLGNIGAIRFDDPTIHINIQCDCYVFQPKIGSVVQGLVKRISQSQIAVIIYRVFSVPIRLSENIDKQTLKLNSEIEFRIKNFDLQNTMPYIEGELMCKEDTFIKNKSIKFDFDSDVEEDVQEDLDNDEKLFKKPKIPEKTACEIAAESETEEIVFSELRYLSNKEAKKLKKKKKHNSESNSSSDTNDDTKTNLNTPKSILKKKISFVIDSDNSRNTSDSEKESSNKKSKKSKKNLKTESPKFILNDLKSEKLSDSSSSSESETENNQYLVQKKSNKDTTDNSTNKVKIENDSDLSISDSDTENDNFSIKKENISVLNGIDSSDETVQPNVESIKKISFANSSSSESENDEPKASNNQSIVHDIKSEIDSNSEDENISITSSRKTKTDITDDSDTNEIPIKNYHANNNEIKIEQQTQEENIEIKTEFLTPIKNSNQKHNAIGKNSLKVRNGYESEDLFEEYTQTQLIPNQSPTKNGINSSSKKNKKERKNSLTNAMNKIVQKTKQKQSKLTDFIYQPAHSTQQTDSSNKSLSDSSFNKAFKDILIKSKKDKLSESENEIICGTPTEIFPNVNITNINNNINIKNNINTTNKKNIQNNSNGIVNGDKVVKKKRKKSENFNLSMTEIIKRTLIEKTIKEEKLSQELITNNAADDTATANNEIAFKKIKLVKQNVDNSEKKNETQVKEKKKSRKRKISLNESMNNILAEVMKKKSKEITENADTPPKKKLKLLQ